MTSSSDWLPFHQINPSTVSPLSTPYATTSAPDLFLSARVSEATVLSTTMSSISNPSLTGPAQVGPNPGRVSKPARKRTRASRRTPTTTVNTDTSNFRAMVQQFTGGASNNFDIPGPGLQMYGNGMGCGYGLHNQMGQVQQQQGLSTLQYSISSNNNNNIMFMQRNIGESFAATNGDGGNIKMNVRLTGTGGGGTQSTQNKSVDSFHFKV